MRIVGLRLHRVGEQLRMITVGAGTILRRQAGKIVSDEARSADHRHHRLQPLIDGDVGGDVAAHRIAGEADLLGIDLRLLLQERDRPTTREGQQEPVPVSRTDHRIDGVLVRQQIQLRPLAQGAGIELRSLAGIDLAPVRVLLDLLDDLPTAPVDIERRVSLLGEVGAAFTLRPLPTAMRPHECGALRHAFGKGVKRRNASVRPLERSDLEKDVAGNDAILLPFLNDLRLKGIFPGIHILPEIHDVLRHIVSGVGRQRVGSMNSRAENTERTKRG